jgi:cytochrome c peroxidase
MRLRHFAVSMLLTAMLGGCQRAEHYGPRAVESSGKTQAGSDTPKKANDDTPLDPDIQWIDVFDPPKPDVLLDFVHAERAPKEWAKLAQFWNAAALTRSAALLGLPPLVASPLAAGNNSPPVIKIKVPLGLPDPREYIPADNPLTLGKWKLGQRLFFDDSWLEAKAGTSCATCHRPDHGFSDSEHAHRDGFNAPTLINCAFNRSQFWDGRASRLEEVIQRTLEDERASDPPKPFRHTWSGVIHRLRKRVDYHEQFNEVFGTPPDGKDGKERANITQDTVGRAVATYLRTILAGDSIHDRAEREQHRKNSPTLKAEHYEAVLDDAALKELEREKATKAEVAAELMRGYRLFSHLDERRPLMNCVECHSGRNFTDQEFHNLGIGSPSRPGEESGRFAQAPIGQKNRYLIDAYKTPTLRNLPRTGPYFHNGEMSGLRDVVEFYNQGASRNEYLDRKLLREGGRTRQLGLNTADIDALVLFLSALNGRAVAEVIKKPPSSGK